MRKWGLEFITLTYNNEHKNITDDTTKKHAKRLLDALRDKAKREGWSYKIWVFFSREEMKPDEEMEKFIVHKQKSKRPHFHIILYANPCTTITKWMRYYWNAPAKSKRRRLGVVHSEGIFDLGGAMRYSFRQAVYKPRIQCCERGEVVDIDRIKDYEIEREMKLRKPL